MKINYGFLKVCLPYCLKKQEDGKYLVLNRNYKPLSFSTVEDTFLSQDLPIYLNIIGLTEKKIQQIVSIGEGSCIQDGKDIFLYKDPLDKRGIADYFERLQLLIELDVT